MQSVLQEIGPAKNDQQHTDKWKKDPEPDSFSNDFITAEFSEGSRKNRSCPQQDGSMWNESVFNTVDEKKLINCVAQHAKDQQAKQLTFVQPVFQNIPVKEEHGKRSDQKTKAIECDGIKMLQRHFDDRDVGAPKNHHHQQQQIDVSKFELHDKESS